MGPLRVVACTRLHWGLGVAVVVAATLTLGGVARAACPAAPAGYKTFTASAGTTPKFTVPAGVSSILTCTIGGTGGAFDGPALAPGGPGSMVTATLGVTPGQALQLGVATNGEAGSPETVGGGGFGPVVGDNGGLGGKSSWYGGAVTGGGGGGGGASSIQLSEGGFDVAKLVIAAGGGGAGADAYDYTELEGVGIAYGALGGGAGGGGGSVSGNECCGAGTNGGSPERTYYNGEGSGSGGSGAPSYGGPGGNRGADYLTGPPQCGEDGAMGKAGHEVSESGNGSGGEGGQAGYPGAGSGPTVCSVSGGKGSVPGWGGGGGGGGGSAGGGGGGGGAGGSDPATPNPVEGAGGGGGGGASSVNQLHAVKGSIHYAADGTALPVIEISYAVAEAVVSPASGLAFPTQAPGVQSALMRVTVTNEGAAPLTLGAPGISGAQAVDFRVAADTCSPTEVSQGHSCYYDVVYSRPTVGGSQATLAVRTNDAAHPTIEVPISGATASPTATATPSALPGGGGSPLAPIFPAVLTGLRMTPSAFAATAARHKHRAVPVGTQLSFGLSEPATVTLTFASRLAGHLRGGRCLAAGHTGRRCSILRRAGTIRLSGAAGPNRFFISGRVGGVPLSKGRWTASVVARDAAGHSSAAQTLIFEVV